MGGNETKQPPQDWSGASRDELRSWRSEALRNAEDAELGAAEAQRLSEMYDNAAEKLEDKALEAEAKAKACELKGDVEGAESFREGCAGLRAQAQVNSQKADINRRSEMEKGRLPRSLPACLVCLEWRSVGRCWRRPSKRIRILRGSPTASSRQAEKGPRSCMSVPGDPATRGVGFYTRL